jgi:hypothetical protein
MGDKEEEDEKNCQLSTEISSLRGKVSSREGGFSWLLPGKGFYPWFSELFSMLFTAFSSFLAFGPRFL